MTTTPAFLKDCQEVLSQQGFTTSNTWYHGTSSALLSSIQEKGLVGSGDQAIREATRKTMQTIGNSYTETTEPVFLTPSKELAYYWAEQTVRNRSLRIQGEEEPLVLAINLPDALNQAVKPDVGAASLLLLQEGENYLAYLAGCYQENGLEPPLVDLRKADRMDYLTQLGLAYIDADLDPQWVTPLTP
ncbi:hypothetical protein [Marinospirillum perlucidum]|uniref:hypothetical protein n=1 Tax=Marinospirillum perlucidum TaxID=1982602 RepID=UPI000DF460AA|nr:hypothetical protein [Marinospirillum perlucidum]